MRVDKITGPGNAYVTAAKSLVYGKVGIDLIAGPTEIVIVADGSANAQFVAADLIAQAEHDENASPICITTSYNFATAVRREVDRRLKTAPRRAIAEQACARQGAIAVVSSSKRAAAVVNLLAPEHLEIMVSDARAFARSVQHAGSIFVGPWSTEAMGDYVAGPNHTLPTSGTARFSSPLGVYDFLKFSNVITMNRGRFEKLADAVEVLARAEGLDGHAESVAIRRRR